MSRQWDTEIDGVAGQRDGRAASAGPQMVWSALTSLVIVMLVSLVWGFVGIDPDGGGGWFEVIGSMMLLFCIVGLGLTFARRLRSYGVGLMLGAVLSLSLHFVFLVYVGATIG